mmetsp:Transcript_408/g.1066  ORF Transcript_408/g.1066 Transcript_408/m.1066 type:complete len:330 (+) Transcript_408:736-1725(+)
MVLPRPRMGDDDNHLLWATGEPEGVVREPDEAAFILARACAMQKEKRRPLLLSALWVWGPNDKEVHRLRFQRWLPAVVALALQTDRRDWLSAVHHELLPTREHMLMLRLDEVGLVLLRAGQPLVHLALVPATRHSAAVWQQRGGLPETFGVAALPQQPRPELLVCVGLLPGAVAVRQGIRRARDVVRRTRGPFVPGVAQCGLSSLVRAGSHDRCDSLVVSGARICLVVRPVEDPERVVCQRGQAVGVHHHPAHGHGGREGRAALGSIQGELPSADAAHAEASDVHPVRIHATLDGLLDRIEQRGLDSSCHPRPTCPGGALWYQNHQLLW